jgi:putative mRNA 3-end processing factor
MKKDNSKSAKSRARLSAGAEISNGNGITIRTQSLSVALDPRVAVSVDYTFVSHAHIDHMHSPRGKSKIIASQETKELAGLRGYNLGSSIESAPGVELFDSGHILGSRAALVKDKIFYTGDLSIRDRGFLLGCKGVKCETLVMESTYGRARYVFPEIESTISQVNRFIGQCFDSCRPVVLTGYPLGKAQLISYLFSSWEPVYLHESVYVMNSSHIDMGVDLKKFSRFDAGNEEFDQKLSRGPWIVIAPTLSNRSTFVKELKQKYNPAIATFTGWAMDSRYRYMTGVDAAFPISDHCDHRDLVELAKYCNPSMIYTVHGFASEFAAHLREMGFNAEPLDGGGEPQERLTSFLAA